MVGPPDLKFRAGVNYSQPKLTDFFTKCFIMSPVLSLSNLRIIGCSLSLQYENVPLYPVGDYIQCSHP
jgi:hypothetical protein